MRLSRADGWARARTADVWAAKRSTYLDRDATEEDVSRDGGLIERRPTLASATISLHATRQRGSTRWPAHLTASHELAWRHRTYITIPRISPI